MARCGWSRWRQPAAAAGGGLLDTVLKQLFDRGRPSVVPHLVAVTSPSFPSGHSMLGAIVYLTHGALLVSWCGFRGKPDASIRPGKSDGLFL